MFDGRNPSNNLRMHENPEKANPGVLKAEFSKPSTFLCPINWDCCCFACCVGQIGTPTPKFEAAQASKTAAIFCHVVRSELRMLGFV